MDIILFRPPSSSDRGIYINPIRLQELFTFFTIKYKQYGHSINLVDCWAEEILPTMKKDTLLFVETPDGTQDYLTSELFRVLVSNSVSCCLLGEIVSDGDAKALLNAIGVDNITYIKNWDMQEISIFTEHYILREPVNTIFNAETNFIHFGFTNAIITAIHKNGERVHLPGIASGCENNCTFCRLNFDSESSGLVNDTNFNVEYILDEIEQINPVQRWSVQFIDENFFGKPRKADSIVKLKKIDDLCGLLVQHKSVNRIGIDTRCDTVINPKDTPELAVYRDSIWKKFVAAGLDYVYLGIESVASTQIQRYGKNFNLSHITESINYLKNIPLNFTVGMILFEPMVTEIELQENIRFIKENNLQKNMASLFKEMRYYINSPYVRLLTKNKLIDPSGKHDFMKYHSNTVTYRNPVIANNIIIVRRISELFRNHGYRHSDVSRLMHGDLIGNMLADYHSRIINMEIEILESIIVSGSFSPNKSIDSALDIVHATVNEVIEDINNSTVVTDVPRIKYFSLVLKNIKKSLDDDRLKH